MEDGLVKDTSGRGNDGALYGGAYDASAKALDFSGNQYIQGDTGLTGNFIHSISMWFNAKNDGQLFWTGINGNNGDRINIFFSEDGGFAGNTTTPQINYTFKGHTHYADVNPDQWYHLVCIYSGTDSSNRKIYLDGVETGGDTATDGTGSTTHALNIQTSTFYLNKTDYGSGSLIGSISNFKLYDTVLEPSEVKTLYDMGRMGSVANPQTLQIASSLDVRGDIYLMNSYGLSYPFYDEGSWTPYFHAVDVPTYTQQFGRYTKIGNVVFVQIKITYSGLNTSDGSGVHIADMPFHSDTSNYNCAMVSFHGDYHTMFSPSIGAGSRIDGPHLIIGHHSSGSYVKYTNCNASGSVNMVAQYFIP
jgi:hypothetical protein